MFIERSITTKCVVMQSIVYNNININNNNKKKHTINKSNHGSVMVKNRESQ